LVSIAARSRGFSITGPEVAQVHAQFVGDDMAERGLAQAGRAEDQDVVQRLAALARGVDEDRQLLARLGLADVLVQGFRPQRPLDGVLVG
jgi:hypothetical protein